MRTKPRSRTRTVRRLVTIKEYQCVVCDQWREASKPALTCSTRCRVKLHRLRRAR